MSLTAAFSVLVALFGRNLYPYIVFAWMCFLRPNGRKEGDQQQRLDSVCVLSPFRCIYILLCPSYSVDFCVIGLMDGGYCSFIVDRQTVRTNELSVDQKTFAHPSFFPSFLYSSIHF